MGDNRDNSLDSRFFGSVPMQNLEGKARFIFYSNNGEGYFWQFWKWPKFLRLERFFKGIK
jgi:signal peptidase I